MLWLENDLTDRMTNVMTNKLTDVSSALEPTTGRCYSLASLHDNRFDRAVHGHGPFFVIAVFPFESTGLTKVSRLACRPRSRQCLGGYLHRHVSSRGERAA
jgi:hypothetical protein